MKSTARWVLVLTLLGSSGVAAAQNSTPQIMPVSQIRPGMTGYGLTVFSGFKVERFKVRVISVLHNFLPKQDIILMRLDHPVLRKANVIGGMSGSPIYIDGKLVGALAYGWRFSKEPIAGITPIENMLAVVKRKLRRPRAESSARHAAARRDLSRLALASLSRRDRWWKPRLPRRPRAADSAQLLTRAAVPLNAAGFAPGSLPQLRDAFREFGFEPVQGGGTGKVEGPKRFVPGGALGMQLVSGDLSLTGTGTVTWVRGNDVLAFGHSAFNAGELRVPVVTARIDHTLASVARSFKLSSPAREIGTLLQDRQAAIYADTSVRARTLPMAVTMRSAGGTQVFRARLVSHPVLTANLAMNVVGSALSEALADVEHASFTVETRIGLKGLPPVKIRENRYSPGGVRRAAVFSRGLLAVGEILNNKFRDAEIERLDVDISVDYGQRMVEISGLRVSSASVDPGARVNLTVTFRPFDEPEFEKQFPLEIPASLAGSLLVVEAASGQLVRPQLAKARDVHQFIRNISTIYPGRSVVVSLYEPSEGFKIRGEVITDLPASVVDAFNTASKARSDTTAKTISRRVYGTSRVVAGKYQIRIRVRSEDNE